jgi:hypothetical protein
VTNVRKLFHNQIDLHLAHEAKQESRKISIIQSIFNLQLICIHRHFSQYSDAIFPKQISTKKSNSVNIQSIRIHTIFGGFIGYSFGKSNRALKNPPKTEIRFRFLLN